MILAIIHNIFLVYTILIIVRIIASWFPTLQHQAWMHYLATVTDPYLNLFRRIIPPIGGVLDISPLLALLALRLLEAFIFYVLS
ncbi:MAG: YggT family protein [Simkaniaceae bacterium]|nr:YggT family protein [Simkaniaceae bacterium]